jgi:murein DD-endopeptidase MepM/ murein hydrolase activator NlpD
MGDPVYAAESGTVTFSGWSKGLGGVMVYIKHAGGWETRYMHLQDPPLAKKGKTVAAGEQIGKVGMTGITQSAAHLHFEVLKDGTRIDPESVLRGGSFVAIALLAGVAWVVYKWVL